jgi:hypothetical protein
MNARQYAKTFRVIGMVSFFCGAIVAVILVRTKLIATEEIAIGLGLVSASIPLLIFWRKNKPVCDKCQGRMKLSQGFPMLVYKCEACGEVVETGLHSDY